MKFCFVSADPEGPGICAMFLTLVSFLLVLVTLPFSLCVTVKVSLLSTTEHRVHKNGISADFEFAFLSLFGLSFRNLS